MVFFRILLLASLFLLPGQAFAQDTPAVPVQAVEAETLSAEDVQGPVVLELFSSQACVFCPKADQLLGDLSSMKNIIALSCHVDYFDVGKGSLAEPLCTKRQGDYAGNLHSGPAYTPQMVINGAYDAVGYRIDDIAKVLRKASRPGLLPVTIRKVDNKFRYQIALPEIEMPTVVSDVAATADTGVYDVWIAMIDRPHAITVAEGSNKGKDMRYYNIISDLFSLGQWDGQKKTMLVNIKTLSRHHSFVVLAQKPGGEIIAVGRRSVIPTPTAIVEKTSDDDLFDFFGFFED